MMVKQISLNNIKINIEELSEKHLEDRYIKKFLKYINDLVSEDAKILANKKFTFKQEKEFLKTKLKEIKKRKRVFLVAEADNKIIGTTEISLGKLRQEKIATYGISIAKAYRRIGLGKYLTREIIKLAKEKLRPRPKIIKLEVFTNNKPAIKLYEKFGFKKVARIPKAVEYKGRLISEYIMIKELR